MRLAWTAMSLAASMKLGPVSVVPLSMGEWTFSASVRPLLEGHVVVAPKRGVGRLRELSAEEFDELFALARSEQVAAMARDQSITAFNVALKDGTAAGQPVAHAHLHVLPRRPGDIEVNDDVYDLLDAWTPSEAIASSSAKLEVPDDANREPRTPEAMAIEARQYGEDLFPGEVRFGRIAIDTRQVFYASEHCFAMVNLKPLVPGHVLVVSRRVVPQLSGLDEDEYADLWRAALAVAARVSEYHGKDAANLAVQDGRDAGQSVPHVHIHVLPR